MGIPAAESFTVSSPDYSGSGSIDLVDGTPGDIFTINETVSAGTPITLTVVTGEAALVELQVDAIPEPSSALLVLIGLSLGTLRRRK